VLLPGNGELGAAACTAETAAERGSMALDIRIAGRYRLGRKIGNAAGVLLSRPQAGRGVRTQADGSRCPAPAAACVAQVGAPLATST
jgi:hypothetical protein